MSRVLIEWGKSVPEDLLELTQDLGAMKLPGVGQKNLLVIDLHGPIDESKLQAFMALAKNAGWTVLIRTRGNLYYAWFKDANLVEVVLENNQDWLMFPVNSVVWDVMQQQTALQLMGNEPQIGLLQQNAQKHVVGIAMAAYEQVMEGTQWLWTLD